jgi:hypothetical protein
LASSPAAQARTLELLDLRAICRALVASAGASFRKAARAASLPPA